MYSTIRDDEWLHLRNPRGKIRVTKHEQARAIIHHVKAIYPGRFSRWTVPITEKNRRASKLRSLEGELTCFSKRLRRGAGSFSYASAASTTTTTLHRPIYSNNSNSFVGVGKHLLGLCRRKYIVCFGGHTTKRELKSYQPNWLPTFACGLGILVCIQEIYLA